MAKTKSEEKAPEKDINNSSNQIVSKVDKKFDELNAKIQAQINHALAEKNIDEVQFLSDEIGVQDYIDTGIASLNFSISGRIDGGFPVTRVTEIAGDPSTGKTLLATINAILALIKGTMVYYLDSEQAYDIGFARLIAKTLGIDPSIVEKINHKEIDSIDELNTIVTTIINTFEKNKIDTGCLIIIDSVAMLTTSKEIKDVMENTGKTDMTKAKSMRALLRVIKNKLKHINGSLIYTNHLTHNIGVTYGEKKVTTGGTAIPFTSSVRIELNSKKITKGKQFKVIGLLISSRCKKSRMTTAYKKAVFPIFFNGHFDRWGGLFDLLKDEEIITITGAGKSAKYHLGGVEFGKKNFKETFIDDPKGYEILQNALKEYRDNPNQAVPSEGEMSIEEGDAEEVEPDEE